MSKAMMRVVALTFAVAMTMLACKDEEPPGGFGPPEDFVNVTTPTAEPSQGHLLFSGGYDSEIYSIRSNGQSIKRITRNHGDEGDAAITPAGDKIYYICKIPTAICVQNPGSQGYEVVYEGIEIGPGISISPDGTRLAFSRYEWTPECFRGEEKCDEYDIYVMDLATRKVTKYYNDDKNDVDDTLPTWTPDGSLVWMRNNDLVIKSPTATSPTVLFTKNNVGPITSFDSPDVSPDGTKILVVGKILDPVFSEPNNPDFTEHIWMVPLDGSAPVNLTPQEQESKYDFWQYEDPTWSPDGAQIAFIYADGYGELHVMDADGSDRRPLVTGSGESAHRVHDWGHLKPAVSVGDDVELREDENATFTVRLSEAADEQVTVLYETSDGSAKAPADYDAKATDALIFAPGETEKTVTVSVNDDAVAETTESFYLKLRNPSGAVLGDSSSMAVLRDNEPRPTPTPTTSPSASPTATPTAPPTGSLVEAIAYEGNSSTVWLAKASGTGSREVTQGSSPDIHPGGKNLAIVYPVPTETMSSDIYTVPVTGGTRSRLNGTDLHDYDPHWSPDGSGISWLSSDNSSSWRVAVAEPADEAVPLLFPDGVQGGDWGVVDGQEVVVADEHSEIYLWDPSTGAKVSGSLGHGYAATISPDGTKLAFSSDLHGDLDIYALDLTTPGAQPIHLTTSSATDYNPAWSPDSQWIAFDTNRSGNSDIYKIKWNAPDTEVAVVATPMQERNPDWGKVASSVFSNP